MNYFKKFILLITILVPLYTYADSVSCYYNGGTKTFNDVIFSGGLISNSNVAVIRFKKDNKTYYVGINNCIAIEDKVK